MKKRALILVDHGSTVEEANELLVLICERTKEMTLSGGGDFDIVTHCHILIVFEFDKMPRKKK